MIKFYINILFCLLLFILGCYSDSNKVDIKADTILLAQDTVKNIAVDSTETIYEEVSQMNNILNEYGDHIRKYSKRYGFDWRLILAIIKVESGFYLDQKSEKGAIGLMQIMPRTGRTIAEELGLEEFITPRNNIVTGIYLLWKISDLYDYMDEDNKLKFTLAAYNCGIGRISDAREIVKYNGQNPNNWQNVQGALKMLSSGNRDLHKQIWEKGTPPSGFFSNWEQPISYVNKVTKALNDFKGSFAFNYE